jgi:hypothetical protein
VVLAENPAQNVDAVETVETVFKDGLGYDPVKLTQYRRRLQPISASDRDPANRPICGGSRTPVLLFAQ